MTQRRFLIAAVVAAATLGTLALPVARFAVWNTTPSVPTGLYAVRGTASLHVGERVAVEPPAKLRNLLAQRRYLPIGIPLIKRIAAVRGQRVCRFAHGVTIDGKFAGVARASDRMGRRLPAWSGCHMLRADELFLMNPAVPDSFDGRYFGVLRMTDVIGRATPVLTDEAGNGRHIWFASPGASYSAPNTQGD